MTPERRADCGSGEALGPSGLTYRYHATNGKMNDRFPPIADIGRGIAWGHAVWQKSATIAKANGLRAQKRRSPSKPVEMTVTRGT